MRLSRPVFFLTVLLGFFEPVYAGSFAYPQKNISSERKLDFYAAKSFVFKPWVISPSTTTVRDGLGPLYNASSCVDCHKGNARSSQTVIQQLNPVVKLYDGIEIYGKQLQIKSIPGSLAFLKPSSPSVAEDTS